MRLFQAHPDANKELILDLLGFNKEYDIDAILNALITGVSKISETEYLITKENSNLVFLYKLKEDKVIEVQWMPKKLIINLFK